MLMTNREAANAFLSALYKVDWAKHHLELFDSEFEKFVLSDPHSIGTYEDVEADEYWMFMETKPIPNELGLIAGDFVSCLRSSLDHLATALTMVGGTANERASFPVIAIDNSAARRAFDTSVLGIPKAAVQVIDAFQPYHSGDEYAKTKLWKLHRLWNIDKHRRIPIDSLYSTYKIHCPPDVPFKFLIGENQQTGVRFSRGCKEKVYLTCDPISSVRLGDINDGVIVHHTELREIYQHVRAEIMPAFKCFFIFDEAAPEIDQKPSNSPG